MEGRDRQTDRQRGGEERERERGGGGRRGERERERRGRGEGGKDEGKEGERETSNLKSFDFSNSTSRFALLSAISWGTLIRRHGQ